MLVGDTGTIVFHVEPVRERADRHGHVFAAVFYGVPASLRAGARGTMFHGVAKEVLHELPKPTPVAPNCRVDIDGNVRIECLDVVPGGAGDLGEVDGLHVAGLLARPRERQHVVDQGKPTLDPTCRVVEMVAVTVLSGKVDPTLGDVQGVAQIV